MEQAPVRGKAEGLTALHHFPEEIRCKKGKIEHLLYALFRDAGFAGNVREGLPVLIIPYRA